MMDFNVSQYVFSHGRRPHGRGYWMFRFPGDSEPWLATYPDDRGGFMSFTEAKHFAKLEAADRGLPNFSTIEVCS